MGLLAIVESVLGILKEFLTWQVTLTQVKARKLCYDIDQEQIAKGKELLVKIDAARNAGDLVATSLLLSDAANAALYAARVRSAIPDDPGANVGVSAGIPAVTTPGSGPYPGAKPVASTEPSPAVAPVPTHVIPKVPFQMTGTMSWWGRNPDGSNDLGDVDANGKDLLGAFGDDNHNEQIIGVSIPIKVFHASIVPLHSSRLDAVKAVEERKYKFDILSHVTGKHITGALFTDLGPSDKENRPFDGTYATNKMLGHIDGTNLVTGWITGPNGIVEIKGWDFTSGKTI